MMLERLSPSLDVLRQECVLIQAWKKSAAYIRHHNWYADTLELDRVAIDLQRFLGEIADELATPGTWKSDPLRIVPAPKSQQWLLNEHTREWAPGAASKMAGTKQAAVTMLRPLAHATIRDQVAATAVMLCLADRVESSQGDPRANVVDAVQRRRVVSYGNRLFCGGSGEQLEHRWGSAKLYRAYYEDYRTFLGRPDIAAAEISTQRGHRAVVVHSDLRQFYDRVTPELLRVKLAELQRPDDDAGFFAFAGRLLDWSWAPQDSREVSRYARAAGMASFARVALPQGLVASGFFANVALVTFDQALRESISRELAPGVVIKDACRYVDDLRIVVGAAREIALADVENQVKAWLQRLVDLHAPGLEVSAEKTKAATIGSDERPFVRQSKQMARIQSAVSGGFDAIGGTEILDAVQGLLRSQRRYSPKREGGQQWSFAPVADVRDATVERFAAWRFRNTYRSLRPLLADLGRDDALEARADEDDIEPYWPVERTRSELDDDARAFALGLIERWVEDPSNVRLLRIGLDLWPAADVLRGILDLLRPYTEGRGRRGAPRRVAWYCLAEILRAGATETGFVEHEDMMSPHAGIEEYRRLLQTEAMRLLTLRANSLPWYLRQQALLFVTAHDPSAAPLSKIGASPETRAYRELLYFLQYGKGEEPAAEFATLAILSRRSFRSESAGSALIRDGLTAAQLEAVARKDPAFGLELLAARPELAEKLSRGLRQDLCLPAKEASPIDHTLASLVLSPALQSPLRSELAALRFAKAFLLALGRTERITAIAPGSVRVTFSDDVSSSASSGTMDVSIDGESDEGSMYCPPPWCPSGEAWRFQLGYLLRFVLTANPDFTRATERAGWKDGTTMYRAAQNHWYQRLYGLFNGQSAFGDDWLPISDWFERLLYSLLRWPGCRAEGAELKVKDGRQHLFEAIAGRVRYLEELQEEANGLLLLPLETSRPDVGLGSRPLRACVVQTVIPTDQHIEEAAAVGDLTLSLPSSRQGHRNHLSAALAAVRRMLALRETHQSREGRLDWLILPELAVHPKDVWTHLVPFARKHRTIILAGLTYERVSPSKDLVNSALWIIPSWSAAYGQQIVVRRQGKFHLAASEARLNDPVKRLEGWRPCQWLIGYDWTRDVGTRPLWLTAAVCYDATDLSLATALRNHSDVLAIPSLNKDVDTFDQMSLALHYHMFQFVVVANNGAYGGSNAYWPRRNRNERRLFHLHGQPQASIAFFEIDNIAELIARMSDPTNPKPIWKSRPAGVRG
ncbi:MAG: hypothetical protein HYX65_08160 [Gemmatimonadetes bacterium]|nr:hypothetical protein [Gemmatimonadota bacterium]